MSWHKKKVDGMIKLGFLPQALVLFDAYCTCADIDSRAAGIDTPYATQQLLGGPGMVGVFCFIREDWGISSRASSRHMSTCSKLMIRGLLNWKFRYSNSFQTSA